jgi:hypothetical protein
MKKYIWQKSIIYALLLVLLSGCGEEYLELTSQSNLTADQFYKTEADFETAIAGIYYKWAEMSVRPRMMAEYRSDNIKYWRLLYGEMSMNVLGPSSTEVLWGRFYKDVIHPSNMILTSIDEVEMDAATKNRIKGEAHFFRGYAYHWLNLWFEGVPLVLKPTSIEESYELGRSSEADIWAQAESDFSAAVSLLPPESEYGRTNKYVAETFLAKSYMQQQKWGQAETALADVFSNTGNSLEPNWAFLWTSEGQAATPEIMLASIWNEINLDDDMGQFASRPGITGPPPYIEFESTLLSSFEDGDIRRDETGDFLDGAYRNLKYDFGFLPSGYWMGDVVVLRFTDVQLLYAEAISMNAGSTQQQSLDLMNETRARAGLGDLLIGDLPTLDDFVEAILAERRAEFVFECQRYPDLKRHGKLIEKINEAGNTGALYGENYNRIPIPQSEIDKMNGLLVQNPGY